MWFLKGDRIKILSRYSLRTLQLTFIVVQIVFTGQITGYTFKPFDGTTQMPSIVRNKNNNISTIVGGLAMLKCTVLNLGTKTVIWRRADRKDPITVGSLTWNSDDRFKAVHIPHLDEWQLVIKDAKVKDTGLYECQISSTDRSIRQQVYLSVEEFKPGAISVINAGISISNTTYVDKGEPIVLICNATSDEVDWFKHGHKITSDPHRGISITKHVHSSKRMITSELRIERAGMDDDSDYLCRSSDMQTDDVKVHVLNAGKPKPPRDIQQPSQTSDTQSSNSESHKHRQFYTSISTLVCSLLLMKYLLCR